MSRLIGALPDRCKPLDEAKQKCHWRTYFATYGHGTLAASMPVPVTKKVDLVCQFPLDGGARAPGESCLTAIVR
ncbi:MAG: hypothetical protein AB8G23_16050 [Myxococcota bacterium]